MAGIGGAAPVFVGGPCVATPDGRGVEVFGRSSDGHIYRRAFDGSNWSSWSNLTALDGTMIDARSDLDCSATLTSVHLVAGGLKPAGVLLHAFGFGTAYNPLVPELSGLGFSPSPSVALVEDGQLFLGVPGPGLYELDGTASPKELTPIPTQSDTLRSSPDIALQPTSGSGLHYFATFDATGALDIFYYVTSSAAPYWGSPVQLASPAGSFALSPTICTENGGFGPFSVSVAAVAGGRLWHANAPSITSPFSTWTMIATDVASSPDCVIAGGADSIVHIVALSSAGTVVDVNGNGTSWTTSDLGTPR